MLKPGEILVKTKDGLELLESAFYEVVEEVLPHEPVEKPMDYPLTILELIEMRIYVAHIEFASKMMNKDLSIETKLDMIEKIIEAENKMLILCDKHGITIDEAVAIVESVRLGGLLSIT